jgi:hypothetical protein
MIAGAGLDVFEQASSGGWIGWLPNVVLTHILLHLVWVHDKWLVLLLPRL